jgi:hypothetical protein
MLLGIGDGPTDRLAGKSEKRNNDFFLFLSVSVSPWRVGRWGACLRGADAARLGVIPAAAA